MSSMAESVSKQLLSAVTEGQTNPQLLNQSSSSSTGAATVGGGGARAGAAGSSSQLNVATGSSSRGGGSNGGAAKPQQKRRPVVGGGQHLQAQSLKNQKKGSDSGKITKPERRPSNNCRVSGSSAIQELRKSLPARVAAVNQRDAEEAKRKEVAAVVPDGQKRKSRRSSNFNYNLEDSDDSDCGEFY